MHFWRIGAAIGTMVSLSGLVAINVLDEPHGLSVGSSGDVFEFDGYTAEWGSDDLDCEEFNSCVHVLIIQKAACSESTIIEFTVTDEADSFLLTQRIEVSDAVLDSRAPVEIGTMIAETGYFEIDNVSCSSLLGTLERVA